MALMLKSRKNMKCTSVSRSKDLGVYVTNPRLRTISFTNNLTPTKENASTEGD